MSNNSGRRSKQDLPESIFRAFSSDDFQETSTWRHLKEILRSNGGCYGIYGPRGAGKSWLMMKAIDDADKAGGIGLWFPCPSKYDSNAFLTSLSDNLANVIERKFYRDNRIRILFHRIRSFLFPIAAVIFLAYILIAKFHFLSERVYLKIGDALDDTYDWTFYLLLASAIAVSIALLTYIYQPLYSNRKKAHLVREASRLRERIRYTTSLKLGSELALAGGRSPWTAALKRSREKALDERPTTIASLVFDFRNLAELAARTVSRKGVIIGIDELDKIESAKAVRALLRDIKGIFEVTGVHYLVSVSEEAAAALQLGTIRARGRDEFNSSFYTVLELPPLQANEAIGLLQSRRFEIPAESARHLCLLAGGNQRELIRMADRSAVRSSDGKTDEPITSTLLEEWSALMSEITTHTSADSSEDLRSKILTAIPGSCFSSTEKFTPVAKSAINVYWDGTWLPETWEFTEPWRRLLVRLFIAASILDNHASQDILCNNLIFMDLQYILQMAGRNASVGKLMLQDRFGSHLTGPYRSKERWTGSSHALITGTSSKTSRVLSLSWPWIHRSR